MKPIAGRRLVVAWDKSQPRTRALGPALGGESHLIYGGWPGRQAALLPLRYLADASRMWRMLRRRRPEALVVISPPTVAPLVACVWSLVHPCLLVVDCHTAALHSPKWGWTLPLHRLLFRRADTVLVHTEEDDGRVRGWGVPALLLPDDLPDADQADPSLRSTSVPRVVVAGSFDRNEPVALTLAAAALLPDMEVRLTGDVRRLAPNVRSKAPENAVFTGYLSYPQFLGELLTAEVVVAFSTDRHIMNRAAFEAVGLGRPLVLSDLPGLRARFGEAALFCRNEPAAMAQTIRQAHRDGQELAKRSQVLRRRLQAQREAALAELRSMVEMASAGRSRGPVSSAS
ncbi:MAG TPA: glycosyltransferase [Candidatus Dormibacteraeota bacterium]